MRRTTQARKKKPPWRDSVLAATLPQCLAQAQGCPLFFDLDDKLLTNADRARMLRALLKHSFAEMSEQEVVSMVGRAAQREGKSFDESLNAYFILYAKRR